MESAAVVLRQPLSFSSSRYSVASSSSKEQRASSKSVTVGRGKLRSEILSSGFCDQDHLQYYNSNNSRSSSSAASARMMSVVSGKKDKATKDKAQKKMKKKQLKLLKGLSRDLSTLSRMGFGLDSDGASADRDSGVVISEAAELLLQRLQKIEADEKEKKRKMRQEKARLKAAEMHNRPVYCEMSSGSSSESSDSECGEVVDMKSLKRAQAGQNGLQQAIEEATLSPNISETRPIPVLPRALVPDEKLSLDLRSSGNLANKFCPGTCAACTETGDSGMENVSGLVDPPCSRKIEVCMGGKCKKSGAAALLEKFQQVVGIEGAVSGCKCMGKCRDGPNVKVLNGFDGGIGDDSVRTPPGNSLCIAVGLEDVETIAYSFVGQNHPQPGFTVAS